MDKVSGESSIHSIKLLFFWFISASLAGVVGTLIVYIFNFLYTLITSVILNNSAFPVFIYPILGAILVGSVIYRIEPKSMGEGLPSYLAGLKDKNGQLPFKETFFKFWAALITLSTFGNGGFIGPIGRVTSGIMSSIGKILAGRVMRSSYIHMYTICGLSAAIGALLGSPVGAGIFAVEIIQKTDMKYRDLFPSILSSSFSVYFARIIGLKPIISFTSIHTGFDIGITGWLLLVAVVAGLTGYGYIMMYETISRVLHRDHNHRNRVIIIKVITGSFIAGIIAMLINVDIMGTSDGLFKAVLNFDAKILYGKLPGTLPMFFVLTILVISKAMANCFTIGSGLSAGFTGPAMLIGLLIGSIFISIAGIAPNTPEYFAFLAAGFAGMLSSTMNTPVATAIITLELFGLAYSLPAGMASIIGFQVNRSNTLYDFAVMERKEEYE